MANRFLNNIKINDSYELPPADGTENQIIVTDGTGNLSFDDLGTITGAVTGVESNVTYYEVKNSSGSQIVKGKGVMAVGTDGNSGHILIDEMVADGSIEPRYFLGVLNETLNNGDIGRVISFGEVDQINTNGQNGETWSNGQVLWCDPDSVGDFTITEPDGPNVKIPAAFILKASTNGKIQVRVQANEGVKNLYDTKIQSQIDGDVLVWDNTTGVWFNDSTLNVDYTNNRVGIGTTDPDTNLEIEQSGTPGIKFNNTATGLLTFGSITAYNNTTYRGGLTWAQNPAQAGAKITYVGFPSGSQKTGTFEVGANFVSTSINDGSMVTRLTTTGLGIGETSPAQKLHVDGSIRVGDTNDVVYADKFFAVSNANLHIGANNGYDTVFFNGPADERMRITSTGDVGIGTTSPDYKLEVNGTLGVSRTDGIIFAGSIATGTGSKIVSNTSNDLIFSTALSSAPYTTTERVRILNNGDVGIGTTSPSPIGTNITTLDIQGSSGGGFRFGRTDGTEGGLWTLSSGTTLGSISNIPLYFRTNNNTKATILANGNFGIGTTSPQEKLHVQNYTTGESHQAMFKGGAVNVGDYSYISLNNGYYTEYNKEVRLAAVSEQSNSNKTGFAVLTSPDGNGASGHERLRVTADGNVGIATTSPRTKLHVAGLTGDDDPSLGSSTAPLFVSNTATSYGLNIGVNNVGASWLQAQSNTSPIAYDLSLNPLGGDVGVGTISPSEKLHVKATSSSSSSMLYLENIAWAVNMTTGIAFKNGANYAGPTAKIYTIMNGAGNQGGEIRFATLDYSATNPNPNTTLIDRMTIDDTGDVGIGTTSPTQKLTIGGIGIGNTDGLKIEDPSNTAYGAHYSYNDASTTVEIGGVVNNSLRDCISIARDATRTITIDTSERVGIGDTSPSYKLDVNGTGRFTNTLYYSSLVQQSQADTKKDIADIDKNRATAIPFKQYKYKTGDTERVRYGVVVEDIEQYYPELVHIGEDGVKGVSYIDLLVKRVAELEKELEDISLTPGPKGDAGATGPQGPQGATGATGPAGSNGKDGNSHLSNVGSIQFNSKANQLEITIDKTTYRINPAK